MSKGFVWFLIIVGGVAWIGTNASSKPETAAPAAQPRPALAATSTPSAPAPAIAPIQGIQWLVQTDTSAIDDSQTVVLRVASDNDVPGMFGGRAPATLLLRCMENTTTIMLSFNDQFMADIQGYGDVTYRIDTRQAQTKGFEESTDNKWLGLWNGGAAIPFIKAMFGGESIVVRATPYNESPVEATFRIGGLEDKITPLRSACGW